MTYYQITSEERYTIAALRREGFCSAEIARRARRLTGAKPGIKPKRCLPSNCAFRAPSRIVVTRPGSPFA